MHDLASLAAAVFCSAAPQNANGPGSTHNLRGVRYAPSQEDLVFSVDLCSCRALGCVWTSSFKEHDSNRDPDNFPDIPQKNRSRRITTNRVVVWAFWLGTASMSLAQWGEAQTSRAVAEIPPRSVRALNPKGSASPRVMAGLSVRGRIGKIAIQIPCGSEVSYPIPKGTRSLSGVLLYRDPLSTHQGSDPKEINRVQVRFLVDGKLAFERGLDQSTLPQKFTVAVPAAKVFTISTQGEIPGENIYLLDPEFSQESTTTSSAFLLNAGEGFVNFTPLPYQALLHVFYPGEDVVVEADYGGSANQAEITLQYTPDQNHQTISSTLAVALQRGSAETARGTALWKIPMQRGPGMLRVEERVAQKLVYDRELRIAIIPQVNLADISDNGFGVHLSSEGYAFAQDSYASLWGAKWGRVFLRWPVIEPRAGYFDFSRADELVDIYRAQNMRVLAVLGEDSPAWVGAPRPSYVAAWKEYVRATVAHFRGRVDHWDVFNEVDVKYYSNWSRTAPDVDLAILRVGIAAIHESVPSSKTVCCSTGGTDWIGYYRRLFAAGLLPSIDVVSVHPYRSVAPEVKQGPYSYLSELAAIRTLIAAQGGGNPIWSTEANWILGPRGAPSVNAPDIDEHSQAEWVVRVNLLSFAWASPYFLHMPFFHSSHPQIHLDALAAYAQMASWFSGSSDQRLLALGPDVFAVVANKAGQVGAVWATKPGAVVNLTGSTALSVFDFYGNPIAVSGGRLQVSTSPIYFSATGSSVPALQVISQPPPMEWRSLPAIATWTRFPGPTYRLEGANLHVTSSPTQWGGQLISPPQRLEVRSCYVIGFDLNVLRGALGVNAQEKGGQSLNVVRISSFPNPQLHRAEMRFKTESDKPVQIIISGANLAFSVTEFRVSNVGIARCD